MPIGPASHEDYINFNLMTPGGMVCVYLCRFGRSIMSLQPIRVLLSTRSNLMRYISFHKTTAPLADFKFSQMKSVKYADTEFMAAPFALEVRFSLPFAPTSVISTPMSMGWKDALIEAGDVLSSSLSVYISGDSEDQRERWMAFIDAHIRAYRDFSDRT